MMIHLRFRRGLKPRWLSPFITLLLAVFFCNLAVADAASRTSVEAQMEQALGTTISQASLTDIMRVMRDLIAKDPKVAPQIIEILGKDRKSNSGEMSQFVREAIVALGTNATRELILDLVQKAVVSDPRSAPAIVVAALGAAPAGLAYDIVEAAIAALPDPTMKIGDLTISEAIVQAALAASPGLDVAALYAAANRGFQSSLAVLFDRFLGTTIRPDFTALSKQPDFTALSNNPKKPKKPKKPHEPPPASL